MKIYMAAKFSRRDELAAYRSALEAAGLEVVSRWHSEQAIAPLDGAMTHHTAEENAEFAVNDLVDLSAADALLFFSEDPTVGVARGARHVEFGMAMAWNKKIYVVGPRENVFHWLLLDDAFFVSVNDFIKELHDAH